MTTHSPLSSSTKSDLTASKSDLPATVPAISEELIDYQAMRDKAADHRRRPHDAQMETYSRLGQVLDMEYV